MSGRWLSVLLLGAAIGVSNAAEPVSIPRIDLPKAVTVSEEGVWAVRHDDAGPATFAVTTIAGPAIGQAQYAVVGEVRYSGVQGQGYLEMWNHFPGDKAFFTRTLAERGPLEAITGSSKWRPFALPFTKGTEPDPEKLVINTVLAGPGTVELRGLRLIAGSGWVNALHPGAWWSPRTTGVLGAVLGITCGLLGMLVGFGMRSPRRYGLANVTAAILCVLGAVSLVVLGVALMARQPFYVYWLFLLFGAIDLYVGADALRKVRKARTHDELRRMEAVDTAIA